MSAAREIVSALIAGGMDPVDAASLMAEAAVEMTANVAHKSAGAMRQQRYRERHKRNESVTDNAASKTSQSVTERHKPSQGDASPNSHIEKNSKKDSMQNSRASRGTRIASDWTPTDADRAIARNEGLSESEVNREALRFRDYWAGRAASGGIKLDWAATWRNWVRTSAEKLGRTPVSQSAKSEIAPSGFYAAFGSEEQDAWDEYGKAKSGKTFPRDSKGGWRHPTQWPPGYTPIAARSTPAPLPPPQLRRMDS